MLVTGAAMAPTVRTANGPEVLCQLRGASEHPALLALLALRWRLGRA
jgi:hypothetical protein